ncbi:hypothetical protein ACLKA6_016269, partial [Drosophila palustris]
GIFLRYSRLLVASSAQGNFALTAGRVRFLAGEIRRRLPPEERLATASGWPQGTPEQMTDEIQKINKLMLPDYPSIEGLIHPWKCRELAGNRYSDAINCRQVTHGATTPPRGGGELLVFLRNLSAPT